MTNAEYILKNLSDVDLAYSISGRWFTTQNEKPDLLFDKAYNAWNNWAESASSNKGNMAKGKHGNTIIKENPSVWNWYEWRYPDGIWKKSGRIPSVSVLVWLSMQYNPAEWEEEE